MNQSKSVPSTILVVDDEPNIRRVFEALFTKEGHTVHIAENGKKALEVAGANQIDMLIADLIMPDMSGVDVLQKVKLLHPGCSAIIITAYGSIKSAVEAMRLGAFNYIQKPFELDEVKMLVRKGLEYRSQTPAPYTSGETSVSGVSQASLDCISEKMLSVYKVVERAADTRATVLIRGESGTGKELIARALHLSSRRATKPFVAVSCAALPETLLESELFGHEKNAFTGAAAAKAGRFELANNGTLFLDEIGDIPASTQIKLLRVLQEWEFERIGATRSTRVDVRLIAATNKNLEKEVADGTFRNDLYYRLNIVTISIPSLRERPEDIPTLALHFIRKYNRENERSIEKIDGDTLEMLTAYRWPGNVRELENAMERAVVLSDRSATILTPDLLPMTLTQSA